MTKRNYTTEDIPQEVWWVKAIILGKMPVGIDMYNKCQEIINKYPQHFEWEHKYKSIPQEVHDAFTKEAYPGRGDINMWILPVFEPGPSNNGMIAQIMNREDIPKKKDSAFTMNDLEDLITSFKVNAIKKEEEEKRIRSIWKKHYGKYNLECRED